MTLEWYLYPLLVGAGFAAGFVNTLAGSGSLLTLPLLIFAGLPANLANGTNRVAIVLQNIVAVGSFRRDEALDVRHGLRLSVPAVAGALLGARIAVDLDETLLRRGIGALLLVMLVLIVLRPRRWLTGRRGTPLSPPPPARLRGREVLVFFAIGLYGGLIQAGVGIFLLAGLVLASGYDLVRANAVKLLVVLGFTVFALAVFAWHGQVDWVVGAVLGAGNMLGAWVGARTAVRRGAGFVRWCLAGVLVVAAAVLLGLPNLLA